MFFGGLLMLGARLGDRFGHRRTITASLAVLAAGALLGAVADSVVLLTAARCLQGAAAAASVPSALRLLTTAHCRRAAAAAGDRGLERGGRVGRRQRLRRRRGRHRPGQLAPGLLGLPAAGCGACGRHRAFCSP